MATEHQPYGFVSMDKTLERVMQTALQVASTEQSDYYLCSASELLNVIESNHISAERRTHYLGLVAGRLKIASELNGQRSQEEITNLRLRLISNQLADTALRRLYNYKPKAA